VNERVPAALDGQRVDRVVAMLTGLPRADVAELISTGAVRINDRVVAKPSTKLRADDEVAVDLADRADEVQLEAEPDVDIPIVHVDDDVIVVDKPAELVVHPGAGNARGTMVAGLLARFPELAGVGAPERPGVVHRLDKGTSGLLVVARTPRAYDALVAQLSARAVDRRYTALVWGHPEPPTGLVDAPIGRSRRDPTHGGPRVRHWNASACAIAPVTIRVSFPAASSSALRSLGPLSRSLQCCSRTNPPEISTP